jgi:predicted Zn-dependent peptidase
VEAVGTEIRLPNGLRILVREHPTSAVVAATLLVGVGSVHETAAANGVTTLLGRTVLKGTRSRSGVELAQAAEDAGGGLEAATDQEYCELRAYGLARHWRRIVDLLREVAAEPSLEPEEVRREREVLAAQIRGLDDQPFAVASRLLGRALYGSHPFGLPTIGELEAVTRLGRAELLQHRETFFTPGRMVLAVSGQVSGPDVLAHAAERFGPWPRGAAPPPLPGVPPIPVTARLREIRPTQQAQLLLGLGAPPLGHPDHVPFRVLASVLGGGMSSRLFRALRDEAGLAYAVGAVYPTRRHASRLVLHIGTAPANLVAAESGIRGELMRLRDEPVPEPELDDAKAALVGAFTLDLRTNARCAFYLGLFELLGLGHRYVRRYVEAVEAVTVGDLERIARRYLVEPAVVVVGPG